MPPRVAAAPRADQNTPAPVATQSSSKGNGRIAKKCEKQMSKADCEATGGCRYHKVRKPEPEETSPNQRPKKKIKTVTKNHTTRARTKTNQDLPAGPSTVAAGPATTDKVATAEGIGKRPEFCESNRQLADHQLSDASASASAETEAAAAPNAPSPGPLHSSTPRPRTYAEAGPSS